MLHFLHAVFILNLNTRLTKDYLVHIKHVAEEDLLVCEISVADHAGVSDFVRLDDVLA